MATTALHEFSWERMIAAVEAVRERASRAAAALKQAGIPYTVVDGNAVPTIDALVRMKLTAFRLKDRVHLLDMLEVGLIDESWARRFPTELAERLQELIGSRDREA